MTEREPTPSALKTMKAECAQCGGVRNCDIRGEYDHTEDDEDQNLQWGTKWRILQCRGCEYVFLQTSSWFSEHWDYDAHGELTYVETIKYWPPLSKREMPEWMDKDLQHAAHHLEYAIVELYGALNNDLHMLAAIGIRTTYDIASELLGIDPNLSFEKKLDSLVSSGRIGPLDKDRLKMLVDAGSASAHRGWRPTPADLNTMMDVLENFMLGSFVEPARKKRLDAEAAKVHKTVPQRTKMKPTAGTALQAPPPPPDAP